MCYICGVTKRITKGVSEVVNEQLRAAIAEKFPSESAFGRAMGWPRQMVSKTIHGQRSPKLSDVNLMSVVLGRSVGEIISFFNQ